MTWDQLMDLEYYSEFCPLVCCARKFSLIEKLAQAEIARVSQADRKDFKKFVEDIKSQINDLESEAEDKQRNYEQGRKQIKSVIRRLNG